MNAGLAGRFIRVVIILAGQWWLGLKRNYRNPLPRQP
jgi:hypothetical protein